MFKASAIAIGIIMIGTPVPAQDRTADKAAAESAFKELAASYATNDLKKVATLYNDPFVSVAQNKAITGPELEKQVQATRDSMPKDFAAAKFKQLSSKPLGKDIVLVSYVSERQNKDGQTVGTGAGTQLWIRTDKGWKFLVGVGHSPEDYVKLD